LKFEAGCQGFIPEILATQEVEIVKPAVWSQPGQKVQEIDPNPIKSWAWYTCLPSQLHERLRWGGSWIQDSPELSLQNSVSTKKARHGSVPVISATVGSINRIRVQASPGKKQDPISGITRAKRAKGVTWAVEHLPCKCKGLSSNTSPRKKKKRLEFETTI
jgi:hypothetical protein